MKTFNEMYNDFIEAARRELKEGLAQCTGTQQDLFKRMYAGGTKEFPGGDLKMPIGKVVDKMPIPKLNWAMQQVKRTLDKKENT